jgi:hypothetical protein
MLPIIVLAATLYALPPKVRGDFDGDGKVDVAEIVKTGGAYRLLIHRGSQPRKSIVVETFGPLSRDFFLDTARSGKWKTWCGKGGGSDDEPCPRTSVVLKGGELTFGVKEASGSVAIWSGSRFEVVLLSD